MVVGSALSHIGEWLDARVPTALAVSGLASGWGDGKVPVRFQPRRTEGARNAARRPPGVGSRELLSEVSAVLDLVELSICHSIRTVIPRVVRMGIVAGPYQK